MYNSEYFIRPLRRDKLSESVQDFMIEQHRRKLFCRYAQNIQKPTRQGKGWLSLLAYRLSLRQYEKVQKTAMKAQRQYDAVSARLGII